MAIEVYELKTQITREIKKDSELINYVLEKNKEMIKNGKDTILRIIMPFYERAKNNSSYSLQDAAALELIALSAGNDWVNLFDGMKDYAIPDVKNIASSCINKEYQPKPDENKSLKSSIEGIVARALNSNAYSDIANYIEINIELNK